MNLSNKRLKGKKLEFHTHPLDRKMERERVGGDATGRKRMQG